jgi:CheY-like chemotaxis protein
MKVQEQMNNPENVLVVDDASIMRVTSERVLTRAGYQVSTADSGEDALLKMARGPSEVVLLDIKMPGISGVEVLRRIKQDWPATEVVIMTAYADHDIAEESLNLGASDILIKPVDDINHIVESVSKAMIRAKIRQEGNRLNDRSFEQLLVTQGLISHDNMEKAKNYSAQNKIPLRESVISQNLASEEEIDWNIAQFLEIPYLRVYEKMLDPDLVNAFPPALAHKYTCLPLWKEDGVMHLVMSDPFNTAAIHEIEKELGMKIKPAKGVEYELAALIKKLYGPKSMTSSWNDLVAQFKTANPAELRKVVNHILEHTEVEKILEASMSPAEPGLFELRIAALLKQPKKVGGK